MSRRNSREAKARRRAERAARKEGARPDSHDLVSIHSMPELAALAERGETMPCGCDAHGLLHEMLGQGGPASRAAPGTAEPRWGGGATVPQAGASTYRLGEDSPVCADNHRR